MAKARKNCVLIACIAFLCVGCGTSSEKKTTHQSLSSKDSAKSAPLPNAVKYILLWQTDSIFQTPESVCYDSVRNVLFVSNINMNPRKKDGNGYISLINPDGSVKAIKWVEDLSAPKGMAIKEDKLYVTDIDRLVEIDILSSEVLNTYMVENAGMLNDICIDDKGVVYVSDMDSSVIYSLKEGLLKPWLSEGLNSPNGLIFANHSIYMASAAEGSLNKIDMQTKKIEKICDGLGRADGVLHIGENKFIVSNWKGGVNYIDASFSPPNVQSLYAKPGQNTADLGYIPKSKTVYVPTFFDNRVLALQSTN